MSYTRGPGPLQNEHEKLKADVGIVEDGDAAVHAITNGQYVIWKGDLYIANTNISVGTALSSSNLTAKSSGLGGEIASLNSNLATKSATVTMQSGVTNLFFQCRKSGNVVTLNGALSLSSEIAGTNYGVATLPAGFRPSGARDIIVYTTYAGNSGMYHFTVKTDGSIFTNVGGSKVSGTILFSCAFCI